MTLTARDLIQIALEDAGIIGLGSDPEAAEVEACRKRLNLMLGTWAGKGAGLWRLEGEQATVLAGESSVTLPASVREVTDARVVESASYERQLGNWTRADYQSLPNKAATGSPTIFYLDRQRDAAVLHVWPVPLTDTVLQLDIERHFGEATDLSAAIDVPAEYLEAVTKNLAVRCAPIFGAQLDQMYVAQAIELERLLLDQSRPASYFMRPAA